MTKEANKMLPYLTSASVGTILCSNSTLSRHRVFRSREFTARFTTSNGWSNFLREIAERLLSVIYMANVSDYRKFTALCSTLTA